MTTQELVSYFKLNYSNHNSFVDMMIDDYHDIIYIIIIIHMS